MPDKVTNAIILPDGQATTTMSHIVPPPPSAFLGPFDPANIGPNVPLPHLSQNASDVKTIAKFDLLPAQLCP
jgi:hypothetical protein